MLLVGRLRHLNYFEHFKDSLKSDCKSGETEIVSYYCNSFFGHLSYHANKSASCLFQGLSIKGYLDAAFNQIIYPYQGRKGLCIFYSSQENTDQVNFVGKMLESVNEFQGMFASVLSASNSASVYSNESISDLSLKLRTLLEADNSLVVESICVGLI